MLALDRWIVGETLQAAGRTQGIYDDYQFHVAVQKIHNFCSETLGGFYLDIIKDRQYTTQADSLARSSCQTAHVPCHREAMTRWIAPILSFTADEIWENMPGDREELGVFAEWYDGLFAYSSDDGDDIGVWDK